MASLVPVTTNRIGAHLPLLQLLPDGSQYSWVRGGDGIVGKIPRGKNPRRAPADDRDPDTGSGTRQILPQRPAPGDEQD